MLMRNPDEKMRVAEETRLRRTENRFIAYFIDNSIGLLIAEVLSAPAGL
jgi:hypothetical protein